MTAALRVHYISNVHGKLLQGMRLGSGLRVLQAPARARNRASLSSENCSLLSTGQSGHRSAVMSGLCRPLMVRL